MTDAILDTSHEQDDSPVTITPQPHYGHIKGESEEDNQTADTSIDHDMNKNHHHQNNNNKAPCSPDSLGISHCTQATVICDSLSNTGEGEDDHGHVSNNNETPHRPKLRMKKQKSKWLKWMDHSSILLTAAILSISHSCTWKVKLPVL